LRPDVNTFGALFPGAPNCIIKGANQGAKFMPSRKRGRPPTRQPQDTYSIEQFCVANGISVSTFYALKRKGLAPRMMKIGGRFLVTPEAMADWRRQREEDAATH
jgi:predicted DNA-binding transcriptional regulator AlpA